MKIFDLESKIETNLKQLEFYYEMDGKIESKMTILVVLYSFIFVYLIELFKYFIDAKIEGINIIFFVLFLALLVLLVISVRYTWLFQRPEDVLYVHEPNYFYTTILERYKKDLGITEDATEENEGLLNEYVNHTYLREQEIALNFNIKAYRTKRKRYYFNFIYLLFASVAYVFTASFVIFENRNQNTKFEIKNYKEIINYIKTIPMATKPKIDPKMIITSQPIAVKQSGVTRVVKASVGTQKNSDVKSKVSKSKDKR